MVEFPGVPFKTKLDFRHQFELVKRLKGLILLTPGLVAPEPFGQFLSYRADFLRAEIFLHYKMTYFL